MVSVTQHFAPNNDGWLLHLKQVVDPDHLARSHRPIVIVPGYGMNSFIFGYHPRGTSMESELARAGFEVWSITLRNQGDSRPNQERAPEPSIRAFADIDLTAAIEAVLSKTVTERAEVHLIGASLGGTLAYAHLALRPDHRVASLVTIGSPLRWDSIHPLLKIPFRSPRVVGLVRVSGVRRLARAVFPLLLKAPRLLSVYVNADNVDPQTTDELVRTIDDPHPRLNQDIARWFRTRDLILRGVNVTQALRTVDVPLLVVLANRDGIVPPESALSVLDAWGSTDLEILNVGDERKWFAHADLFIAPGAPKMVFEPIARFFAARD